jgi:WD40 repeat protein
MKKSNNKPPYKLFGMIFLVIIGVAVFNGLRKNDHVQLLVPDNAGVSVLETAGEELVCVFKGGQVASWDWGDLSRRQADFSIGTDRVIVLDAGRLAAVSVDGKKRLSVYRLPDGEKIKDIAVGFADQEVWPRMSFDKRRVAVIRQNPAAAGTVLYEFLTVDLDKALTGIPVSLAIDPETAAFVEYAVDAAGCLYAVGSKEKIGRIVTVDLEKGTTLWDRTYEGTGEFCSVIASPDNTFLLAGNRNGMLYKLAAETGDVLKEISLLEPGETRPITNDYSVLHLTFSPDGRSYAAAINPRVYLLKAENDSIFHTATPADKLVSKIAFSPDNAFVATSDIRQSYPVKIWPLPQE